MMLSEREYDMQYSKLKLFEYDNEEMNVGYVSTYSQIGSLDSDYPKNIKFFFQGKRGSSMKPTKVKYLPKVFRSYFSYSLLRINTNQTVLGARRRLQR